MNADISSKFPFDSKFIEINGSKMHYVDVGKGDTILFLHGQLHLTSGEISFLIYKPWRDALHWI